MEAIQPVYERCQKRIDSAKKMRAELKAAADRERKERALIEKAAEAEKQRKREAREIRSKRLESQSSKNFKSDVEGIKDEPKHRHAKKHSIKQPKSNRAYEVVSAAKPRELLSAFTQASQHDADEIETEFELKAPRVMSQEKKVRWNDTDTSAVETKLTATSSSRSNTSRRKTFGRTSSSAQLRDSQGQEVSQGITAENMGNGEPSRSGLANKGRRRKSSSLKNPATSKSVAAQASSKTKPPTYIDMFDSSKAPKASSSSKKRSKSVPAEVGRNERKLDRERRSAKSDHTSSHRSSKTDAERSKSRSTSETDLERSTKSDTERFKTATKTNVERSSKSEEDRAKKRRSSKSDPDHPTSHRSSKSANSRRSTQSSLHRSATTKSDRKHSVKHRSFKSDIHRSAGNRSTKSESRTSSHRNSKSVLDRSNSRSINSEPARSKSHRSIKPLGKTSVNKTGSSTMRKDSNARLSGKRSHSDRTIQTSGISSMERPSKSRRRKKPQAAGASKPKIQPFDDQDCAFNFG